MYDLFRLAEMIVPRLPRWFSRALGRTIGLLAWLVATRARKQATINMIQILDHGNSGASEKSLTTRRGRIQLRRTVQRMFQNSVFNYIEVFSLPRTRSETIIENIQIEGQEYLDAALAQGKGVILFSAHFGPFDYLSQWIALKGYHLTIPVEHLKDERMLALMLRLRRSHGVNFLPLGGSSPMRAIIQALRNNQVVLITADRAVQGESVEVPFFGSLARLPVGPAILAQRTGAALLGAFGWRTYASPPMQGQFMPLSLKLSADQQADPHHFMRGIVDRMEQIIAAHPEQWVLFTPIWKNCREGAT